MTSLQATKRFIIIQFCRMGWDEWVGFTGLAASLFRGTPLLLLVFLSLFLLGLFSERAWWDGRM